MSRHHRTRISNGRWERVRREVLERDGWRCVKCGAAGKLEVDHITPLDRGGDVYDPANLQTLCGGPGGGGPGGCHAVKTAAENRREPESTAIAREAWRDYCRTLAKTAPGASRTAVDGRKDLTEFPTLARR